MVKIYKEAVTHKLERKERRIVHNRKDFREAKISIGGCDIMGGRGLTKGPVLCVRC